MKVYNYSDSGYFIDCSYAQANPLEPGKFLIPRNATTQEPPSFSSNQMAYWNGITWEIQNKPEPIVPPAPIPVIPEPEPEPDPSTWQSTWEWVRSERDYRLSLCDWVVCSDVPVMSNKQAWLEYRQALRDIPQNYTEAANVVWPTKPQ